MGNTVSQMQAHITLTHQAAAGNCPVGPRQNIHSELLSSAPRQLKGKRHLRTFQSGHLNHVTMMHSANALEAGFRTSGAHTHTEML